MVGPVPFEDLRKLYITSQLFVLPSLAEMSPSVISEAMASGKPVIGTRVGGIPTQIVDGVNGFIVDPGDERQLAMKISCLLKDRQLRETMGKNSRRIAEESLTWKKAAEELLKFLEER
jgi:glycosyltransferase involved in cell wall biosynthesis